MDMQQLIIGDPLSEVTRKDRRVLLAISVIGIAIVKANIIPTKLTALGIEFGKTDQKFFLLVIGLITIYFLFAFAIYAFADFLTFQSSFKIEWREDGIFRRTNWLYISIYILREVFEFFFPIIIAIYSMFLLWTADIP